MPRIDEQTLRRQIREREFAPVYLLFGNDSYLKQGYANKIAERIGGQGENLQVQRFDGKGLAFDDIYTAAATLPFGQGRKCIVICDYDWDATPAKDQKDLGEYLKQPFEDTTLVFWYHTIELNPKKSAKTRAFLGLVEKAGCSVLLDHPDPAALSRILCDAAAKRGARMHPSTAKRMIALCGGELQSLMNELDKLCAYAKDREITPEDIDALCSKSVETSVYALSKALTGGDIPGALLLLDELYAQRVEPVVILATLSASYVDMYRAKAAGAAGMRPTDIAKDFGYFGTDFRLRNAAPLAARMSFSELRRYLNILTRADGKLKSARTDPRVIIEQTMLELAGKH